MIFKQLLEKNSLGSYSQNCFWSATRAAKPINWACTAIFRLLLLGISPVNLSLLSESFTTFYTVS